MLHLISNSFEPYSLKAKALSVISAAIRHHQNALRQFLFARGVKLTSSAIAIALSKFQSMDPEHVDMACASFLRKGLRLLEYVMRESIGKLSSSLKDMSIDSLVDRALRYDDADIREASLAFLEQCARYDPSSIPSAIKANSNLFTTLQRTAALSDAAPDIREPILDEITHAQQILALIEQVEK